MFNRTGRRWHGLDPGPDADLPALGRYELYESDGVTPLAPDRVPPIRALREGTVRNAEMINRRGSGDPVRVSVDGRALIAPDGTALGAVAAMNDVTTDRVEQRLIEQARRELSVANERLRRSNADLTNFAGAVGHDLVAPLGAVGGHLDKLGELVRGEQERAWVDAASRAVTRMRELIGSLLGNARAGSAPVRRVPADLGEVFDSVVADLHAEIVAADAEVRAPEPLPAVSCDPGAGPPAAAEPDRQRDQIPPPAAAVAGGGDRAAGRRRLGGDGRRQRHGHPAGAA
ncbi:hypothetical protein [Actinoplanes teichomyceticus]|uniref:histidine kinase n=1 Tax=Actinoplanes teichomyceticus TaxID=1867 RepID=A0A561WKI3_ACTTI|nr:hypothetical protein [Actinoplanes teichomyceticus]TWG24343.1 hypothetical protein FHX34_102897 [Actinoplanes teichomyceticus]GIF12807.1 hypothetical protein Ate01nite_28390 [Actinoplanes teichomyceticus]